MWKINNTYSWQELELKFDWISNMKGVKQNPDYHAEGDVAIHTKLVIEKLCKLKEFSELDEQQQHILMAAALMHDIDKPSTTVVDANGIITSPNHAKKGEHTVRKILYKHIETPFNIREQIAKLVRYHGLPIWLLYKSNPEKILIRTSFEVNTKLLYLLAKADILGRIGNETDELLDRVELFKEYCIELNCWGNARQFKTELAKFQYFKNNSHIEYVPFDKNSFKVIMMSALPGSGKDLYISKYYNELPIISLDELRRKYGIVNYIYILYLC